MAYGILATFSVVVLVGTTNFPTDNLFTATYLCTVSITIPTTNFQRI